MRPHLVLGVKEWLALWARVAQYWSRLQIFILDAIAALEVQMSVCYTCFSCTTAEYSLLQLTTADYSWLHLITAEYNWLQLITADYSLIDNMVFMTYIVYKIY